LEAVSVPVKRIRSKRKNIRDVDGARVSVKLQLSLAQSECQKEGGERDDEIEKRYS